MYLGLFKSQDDWITARASSSFIVVSSSRRTAIWCQTRTAIWWHCWLRSFAANHSAWLLLILRAGACRGTVILGFEQANRYTVLDQDGNVVALLAEDLGGLGKAVGRQLLRTRRAFTATVFSPDGASASPCLELSDRIYGRVLHQHMPIKVYSHCLYACNV